MKKILITSTDLMMVQFLLPHVTNLVNHGYEVELACSNVGGRLNEVHEKMNGIVKTIHKVRLMRSPIALTNKDGYHDLCQLFEQKKYDIVWTNEPVMGVVTRLAARKTRKQGTKIMYMAHGFHFFKGAPLLNWMLFYPIEQWMARYADILVTINKEDYHRAHTFPVKRVAYIHGIGINVDRLNAERNDIREELNLKKNDIIIVSIGELNKNKNQKIIIKALAQIGNPLLHYVLCGKGAEIENLRSLSKESGLQGHVHFLGYRKDIADICRNADIYVMPSKREGLGLAALEAMYLGLPVITSCVRGLTDFVTDAENGFLNSPNDSKGWAKSISLLANDRHLRHKMGEKNRYQTIPYLIGNVKNEILKLIETL